MKNTNEHENKKLTENKMIELKQNPDILFNYSEVNFVIIEAFPLKSRTRQGK